jgi:LuxR family maltose regulon positive regulatory protein
VRAVSAVKGIVLDKRCRAAPQSSAGDGRDSVPDVDDRAVVRVELLEKLERNPDMGIVVVDAPPGYGKTTAIAQWVRRDRRPCSWLTLGRDHDAPDVLLPDLLDAFERVGVLADAGRWEPSITEALPQLSAAMEQATEPFLLVLDGVDHLHQAAAHTVLRVIARRMPPGAQMVLAARGSQPLSIGMLTMQGRLLRVGIDDLAFSHAEAAALLAASGVRLGREDLDELMRRTEGWPAVLALAAAVLRDTRDRAGVVRTIAEDAIVADYIEHTVFAAVPEAALAVLRAGSVLDELSGAACDALLERTGSGQVLVDVARQTSLLRPVDRRGTTYRLHPMVGAVLCDSLGRDPAVLRALHASASAAYELEGDVDRAVQHAQCAGDRERVARLVWCNLGSYLERRAVQFREWIGQWGEEELASGPTSCCVAAWCELAVGDPTGVPRWIELARRGPEDMVLPDGTPLRSALALLRAIVGRDGLSRMLDDATLAIELGPGDNRNAAVALTVAGAALRLLGDGAAALRYLEDANELASVLNPTLRAHALVQLALLAADEKRFEDAETFVDAASRAVDAEALPAQPTLVLVPALRTWLTARRAQADDVAADLDRCERLVAGFGGVMPAYAIEARILLASAAGHLGDYRRARMVLHEAEHYLELFPEPGSLPDRLAAVREQIDSYRVPVGLVASRLTPAEVRVLRLLPTHLSFPEIADALFVSRHTVKTHAVAVYHKLGVSSRRDAVTRARELGLLE